MRTSISLLANLQPAAELRLQDPSISWPGAFLYELPPVERATKVTLRPIGRVSGGGGPDLPPPIVDHLYWYEPTGNDISIVFEFGDLTGAEQWLRDVTWHA